MEKKKLYIRQRFYAWFVKKFFPYWCNYCPKRFSSEQKFHDHFLQCESRKAFMSEQDRALEAIAPVNRDQRRRMAKKSGMIKDWGKLNAP